MNNRKKTATNAKQRHQQDLRGLEEGNWRQKWVAEEIAIKLQFETLRPKERHTQTEVCFNTTQPYTYQ